MAFSHMNSKGQTYFLHSKIVTLRNGRKQTIFFFARQQHAAEAVDQVPAGYRVDENARTGLPFLKKA